MRKNTKMNRERPRDKEGYLIRELTDEKIIVVLSKEYQTPHQIADKLKCSQSGAQKALKRMHQANIIDGGLFGNRWLYRKVGNS